MDGNAFEEICTVLAMTLHVPASLADAVVTTLIDDPVAFNITHLRDVCAEPPGDLITCAVPREWVSGLLVRLAEVGFDESTGTITLDERLTVLGDAARESARRAKGSPDDALVWSALKASTAVATEFSFTYLAFMVLATMLAAIGLLTSSSVLIVGAMILGPEFGALAHLCVSALGRDLRGIGASVVQLLLGFTLAIIATAVFVWSVDRVSAVDITDLASTFERAIVAPTTVGVIIALISGVAGVLTLTSAKGEALIGVLVSVTTIPAAADMAIGLADADGTRIANGAYTLLLNLGGMVVAGGITLALYRFAAHRNPPRAPARARTSE